MLTDLPHCSKWTTSSDIKENSYLGRKKNTVDIIYLHIFQLWTALKSNHESRWWLYFIVLSCPYLHITLLTCSYSPCPSIYLSPRGINKPQNKFAPNFFSPLPNSSLTIALPFSVSPSVVFSFSITPWGRRRCGGNWQPSLHRLSARLLICMALIIDWSLQPQIYDGLSPPPSLSLIRSIFSPPPLNILPHHFPHAIEMHFSSIFLHSLSLDESTEPS